MIESLEVLNRRLKDQFGGEPPDWKIVWSPDELEHRLANWEDRTPEGLFIRAVKEVRQVPKFWYMDPCWMLTRLIEISAVDGLELPATPYSYECIHAFPYHDGKPLFPIWPAIRLLVDKVNEKIGVTGPRYLDPNDDPKIAREVKEERLKELEKYLFSNETDIGDALAYRQGVGYTTAQSMLSGDKEQ